MAVDTPDDCDDTGCGDASPLRVHFPGGPQPQFILIAVRVQQFFEARGLDGDADNLFVVGDINEDFQDFLSEWTQREGVLQPEIANWLMGSFPLLPTGLETRQGSNIK